jgi:hypothetical protein
MCAALNLCGWAHACHSLDVDVLLFGALTVYKQMHLQVTALRSAWSHSILLTSLCRKKCTRGSSMHFAAIALQWRQGGWQSFCACWSSSRHCVM